MDLMTSVPALIVIGAVVIPLLVYAVLGVGERMLGLVRPIRARSLRPWFWLGIPLILMAVILGYPLLSTVVIAFRDPSGDAWAGWANFDWVFSGALTSTLLNSLVWLIVLPIATVVMAVVVGVLFDRVRYERFAATIIVLPTAISFTVGSVIWRQMFSYQPEGENQLGVLNALWTLIPGAKPVPWLQTPAVNTLCLIFVALWATLGVAALIISAALKNVPADQVEAASLDGAGPWRVFFSITLPSIAPSVLVVLTTAVIFSLKVFDIVYVMTNGNFGTNTLANEMYLQLFNAQNPGHASAIAIVLLIVALPVIVLNVRQFRNEGRS